jgi:cytochrome c oxidase subunit 3
MILFITSELMFFGALFSAYFALRSGSEPWPPEGAEPEVAVAAVLTGILATSSVTAHRAVAAIKKGDTEGLIRILVVTIVLGALFLAGQLFEYSRLGFSLGEHSYGTVFFTLTGFHGLHVAIGLVILGVALTETKRGRVSATDHGSVEAASYYWHFVDAVWLLVFVVVYLIR